MVGTKIKNMMKMSKQFDHFDNSINNFMKNAKTVFLENRKTPKKMDTANLEV